MSAHATPPEPQRAAPATVSSLKSEDSTEQLICDAKKVTKQSVKSRSAASKSVEAPGTARRRRRRLVGALGLAQVCLGALLLGAGALAVLRGAALARAGAGLWAGCIAVVAGVVGVLAGINDCYGLHRGDVGSPLLTAFLALSLMALACGNGAAVLAATGLQRDASRQQTPPRAHDTFEDEMQAWSPVLTNIALLIVACIECLVAVASVCHAARRVCSCLRPKQPYDHNQFDPQFTPQIVHVDELKKGGSERAKPGELAKELEGKLDGKRKEEPTEYGSANSKERLVSRWLGTGGAPAAAAAAASGPRRRPAGVRKPRAHAQPMMLLPAHPASTLGRGPPCVMVPPPRYATLPLPPAPYGPLYYPPMHDPRVRRRRSPKQRGGRRRERARDSQLTRSLERIHRKRRADRDRITDDELKRTYTGLDRTYAEQFIAVCDESRHAAERHDSLASTTATSDSSHTS